MTPTHPPQTPLSREPSHKKSNWTPPSGRNQYIDSYVQTARGHLDRFILDNHHHSNKDNLTVNERKAIKTLRSNYDIVIKPADKGGTIAVMDTVDYVAEIDSQLSNTAFYEELTHDPTELFKSELTELINHLNYNVQAEVRSLVPEQPRPGVFYTIP